MTSVESGAAEITTVLRRFSPRPIVTVSSGSHALAWEQIPTLQRHQTTATKPSAPPEDPAYQHNSSRCCTSS